MKALRALCFRFFFIFALGAKCIDIHVVFLDKRKSFFVYNISLRVDGKKNVLYV